MRHVAMSTVLAALLAAQASTQDDAGLRSAFDAWQTHQRTFTEAMMKARNEGRIQKGGEVPDDIARLQKAADDERVALIARFDDAKHLEPGTWLLLARLHEAGRDYAHAVTAYAASLQAGDAGHPDLETYGSLCIAAMNSKDDALAASWMRKLIAIEDRLGTTHRNLGVRTSYLPRTLIALEDWNSLEAHLASLAADPAPECRSAAMTFGVVAAIHRGDLTEARDRVARILADGEHFADQQTWAALARFALDVHDGDPERATQRVHAFLEAAQPSDRKPSAVEQNQRRYLAAVAPFLGRPAPKLRVDHKVGGHIEGDDVLATLRAERKVVVLDFWQPWCEPCRKAMPEMVAAQAAHPDELQVLGVCRVENYGYDVSERRAVRPIEPKDYPAHVADFRADMGLTYPLLIADGGENNQNWAIAGVPTLVVIDREGIVRYMSCGAGEPGLFRLALEGVLGPVAGDSPRRATHREAEAPEQAKRRSTRSGDAATHAIAAQTAIGRR
ncbi:MAG: TlpA disulfide reductase family protein [Planctomycetota bacterium]